MQRLCLSIAIVTTRLGGDDVRAATTCEQWRIEGGGAVLRRWMIWRRAVNDDYLKSAAQLRKFASQVADPEIRKRIISVAEEYEAFAASGRPARSRKANNLLLERILAHADLGKRPH